MYLQIKNVFKKLRCFKPFLPWHELQEPQFPPPQRSCTCQHVVILLTEEKHTKSYCCPDCNIMWELYMKQHLLQRVIHMLFLWPHSGKGIPQACFQKVSCAFPKKTPHSSTGFSFLVFFFNKLPNYQHYLLCRN